MDRQRLGRSVRALRHRLDWRQEDLASRAGVSQTAVSRVERGLIGGISIGCLDKLVVALGGELDVRMRWRGEELDRLLDATHAAIGETVVRALTGLGWECRVEAGFDIRGQRGSVDVLGWHPATGRLLVVESKSVVPDLQSMLGSLDRKVRLAPEIASQYGWRVTGVGRAVVLAGTTANRARAERFGATLRAVLPQDGRALRSWLARPEGPSPAALWFITDVRVMTAIKRRRVRRKRMSSSGTANQGESSVARNPEQPDTGSGPPYQPRGA
jgi:transcriptional regulator with XRE-family HTH domain